MESLLCILCEPYRKKWKKTIDSIVNFRNVYKVYEFYMILIDVNALNVLQLQVRKFQSNVKTLHKTKTNNEQIK